MSERQVSPDIARECPQAISQALLASSGSNGVSQKLPAHRAAVLDIAFDIAFELQLSPEQVATVYCAELARLIPMASVHDYLAVLVAKHVRAQLGHAR